MLSGSHFAVSSTRLRASHLLVGNTTAVFPTVALGRVRGGRTAGEAPSRYVPWMCARCCRKIRGIIVVSGRFCIDDVCMPSPVIPIGCSIPLQAWQRYLARPTLTRCSCFPPTLAGRPPTLGVASLGFSSRRLTLFVRVGRPLSSCRLRWAMMVLAENTSGSRCFPAGRGGQTAVVPTSIGRKA